MAKARKATGPKTVKAPLENFKLVGKGSTSGKVKNPLDNFPLNKVNTNL